MRKTHRGIVALFAFALAVAGLCAGCGSPGAQPDAGGDAASTERPGIADLADYEAIVYNDAGEGVRLSAIADGKPLVVNFWATWCPYCVEEIPDFQEVSSGYGDKIAFAFVDVVDGAEETQEGTAEWLAEYGFEGLPVYYDNDLVARDFGVYAFPTTIIFSADGEVSALCVGIMDSVTLQKEIDKLL
ncbi:MAG: TlpA family protein disulfide reductase [Atopobiaceae bacterium]|nr:TlpA family protein disulfide reductase [Atopobiaceae bacterium]